MKLSVIVPVYNGQESIGRCLNSIKNQIYNDIEIVIVNDGSTDNTADVIKAFTEEISHIPVTVVNKENQGLPQARKSGVEAAHGEYIGFVDADDWIEEKFYDQLMKLAQASNADIVCSEITEDRGDGQRILANHADRMILSDEEAIKLLHQRKAVYQFAWNKIYKKEIFQNVVFPKKNMIGEDYALVVQAICHSKSIALSKACGYHYVILDGSMSHVGYNDNFKNGINMYQVMEKKIRKKYPKCQIYISNFMIQNYMGAVMAMCQNKKFDYEIITWIKRFIRTHLKEFLKYSPFAIHWKIGVTLFAINEKIFLTIYSKIH